MEQVQVPLAAACGHQINGAGAGAGVRTEVVCTATVAPQLDCLITFALSNVMKRSLERSLRHIASAGVAVRLTLASVSSGDHALHLLGG